MAALAVAVGGVALKNPLICGAGEHGIEFTGIAAALDAGAAAVVMKSVNESAAARAQLDHADYVLLDSRWRPLEWDFEPPPGASLFCRSGLSPLAFDDWLDLLARADALARARDAWVIASLIPGDPARAPDLARAMAAAGARVIELNIGPPHIREAAAGAIAATAGAEAARALTARVKAAAGVPIWVKLAGEGDQTVELAAAAFAGGADAVGVMGRFLGLLPDPETLAPVLGTRAAIGGPWALPLTCLRLADVRARVGPDRPLIGTNGARDGLDIIRLMLAGARAVELTSAVFAGGPAVVTRALDQLDTYAGTKDLALRDIVGRAADRVGAYMDQPDRPGHWRSFVHPAMRDPDG